MNNFLIAFLFACMIAVVFYIDKPLIKQGILVEIRLDSLQADNYKLSQNDSTLAAVINQLYRKIKALEADTVKGWSKMKLRQLFCKHKWFLFSPPGSVLFIYRLCYKCGRKEIQQTVKEKK